LTLAALGRRCAAFVNAAFVAAGLTGIAALCLDAAMPVGGSVAASVSTRAVLARPAACKTHAEQLLTPGFVETGIDGAIDVLSSLTRTSVLSKKGMKPHGPAIGIAASFPGATHFRDFDMLIDFRRLLRASAYTVAVSSALAACGGGGGSADDSTPGTTATSTGAGNNESATSIASATDAALI
jgi:hypothetical protein